MGEVAGQRIRPSRSGGKRQGEKGSTLIEFSLTIIPFFAFLFLTMNIAWIIFAWASIQEGAREAVRYGISIGATTGLDQAIRNVAVTDSMGFVKASNVAIAYYAPSAPNTNVASPGSTTSAAGGNVVQVTITLPFKPLVPFWHANNKFSGNFTSDAITLSATSADVFETLPPGMVRIE